MSSCLSSSPPRMSSGPNRRRTLDISPRDRTRSARRRSAATAGRAASMKAVAFAVLRGLNAAYFVVSSLYCVLSYSTFAYAQFIRPQLVGWLPDLIAIHHQLFWLTLVITAPTLVPVIRSGGVRRRAAAAIYLGAHFAVGLWLLTNPVLAMAGPNTKTLVLAILWLVPPFGLHRRSHHGRARVECAHRSPSPVRWGPRRSDRVLAGIRRLGPLVHSADRRRGAVVGGAGGSCEHFTCHPLAGVWPDVPDRGCGIVAGVADQSGTSGGTGRSPSSGPRHSRLCCNASSRSHCRSGRRIVGSLGVAERGARCDLVWRGAPTSRPR